MGTLGILFRLGLMLGVQQLSSGTSNLGTRYTVAGGLTVDRHSRYFGIESEGYFGRASAFAPSLDGTSADYATATSYGSMLAALGRLPLSAAGMRFVPKAGLAGGIQHVKLEHQPVAGGEGYALDQQAYGLLAVIGGDFRPVRWLTFKADYAFSLVTGGALEFQGQLASLSTLPASAPSFNRLRLGVEFRVGEQVDLGLLLVRRKLSFDLGTETARFFPVQWQGFVQVQFRF